MKSWKSTTIIILLILIIGISIYLVYTTWLVSSISERMAMAVHPFVPNPSNIQTDSIEQIALAWKKYGDNDNRKLAYILATAYHESSFEAKKEYRANPLSQPALYNTQNAYWYTNYYGRGYIQLTHKSNYQKMTDFLGVDLVNNPDLALHPKYAAQILVYGMMTGQFGNKKQLSYYINDNNKDYYNARRLVNGTDKAQTIANYSETIEKGLK